MMTERTETINSSHTQRHRIQQRRKENLKFHRKWANILALSFILTFCVLWLITHNRDHSSSNRLLIFHQNQDGIIYSGYSCDDIFSITPNQGQEQCRFAQQCNDNEGLAFHFTFCTSINHHLWCVFLGPLFLLWMVVLFRMLGSTAEDFFSPSLEMFSGKLGLPPRFAGVSLLALGNGSSDVSATINAITGDPQNGYILSLGALTGSAMFIGCVVSGMVILTAKGVPCRGALVRDALALFTTSLVVTWNLTSGSVDHHTVFQFCSMYFMYMLIVLTADVYHRAVHLPKLQREADRSEMERQLHESNRLCQDHLFHPHSEPERFNALGNFMTALSNYDKNSIRYLGGVESNNFVSERPVVLHGNGGLLKDTSLPTKHHHQLPSEAFSMLDQSTPVTPNYSTLHSLHEETQKDSQHGVQAKPNTTQWDEKLWPMSKTSAAWQEGIHDLWMDLITTWREIFEDEDTKRWEKVCLVVEFPITVLRKLTIAVPCEGYYCRPVVATAVICSPSWFYFYLFNQHGINMFASNTSRCFVMAHFVTSIIIGVALLLFAPKDDTNMKLGWSAPVALYGFVMAATWIDYIASHLVSLLEFLGVVCHIPGSIMGLTILAWGNSMGDLSADITMARKGLTNMALTACFAGPVFNILIGLGAGFSRLSAETGQDNCVVQLNRETATGLVFIVINAVSLVVMGRCVLGGKLPRDYGYVMIMLYGVYVTTSLLLGFSSDLSREPQVP